MKLAVDVMDGHVVNVCQGSVILTTEGTPNSNKKTKCFSYIGEWVDV